MIILRQLFLVFLFILAAIGYHVPTIHLYGLRIAVAVALIIGPSLSTYGRLRANVVGRGYLALAWVWIFCGALGCLWAPDTVEAVKEWLHVVFGFTMGVVISGLVGNDQKMARSIEWSWVIVYFVTALVAIWELTSGQHLESSFTEQSPVYVLNMLWVASTFGNPNNYAAFLLVCFPFLLHSYTSTKRWDLKLLMGMFVASLPALMVLSASRGGLVGLIAEILTLATLSRRKIRRVGLALGCLIGMLAACFFLLDFVDADRNILMIFGKLKLLTDTLDADSSLIERLHLYANGLFMLTESSGLGVGPHGFEWAILTRDMPYAIIVPNPHNFWIEVGSQYGVIVLVMLGYWLLTVVQAQLKQIRLKFTPEFDASLGRIILAGCVGYFFAAMENSSYIPQPTNWLFIGTLLALSTITIKSTSIYYKQHQNK